MWTILTDTSDEDLLVFNHHHFPENNDSEDEAKKTGTFQNFKVNFDGTSFSFTRHE